MTIREKMTKRLENHGLWPEEANSVMELMIANESLKNMKTRWNDDCEGYSTQLFSAVWFAIRKSAIQWIDTNKPKHFSRAMFTGEL